MSVSLIPNSPSNFKDKRKHEVNNLGNFAQTSEIWSIDRINGEILPRLLEYHKKMKERFADYQKKDDYREIMSAIDAGLEQIADAIKKFKESEKSVNEQVRDLLPLYLYYIQIEDAEYKNDQERAKHEIQVEDEESETLIRLIQEMNVAVSKLKGKIRTPSLNGPADAVESSPDPQRPEQAADADRVRQVPTETYKLRRVKEKYCSLDVKSKRCLLFLSVFPDNFPVRETDLRLWWIGEGLMPDERRAEEFVQITLLKFEKMGFIQRIMEKKKVKGFKMDPAARGIVNNLARREDFFHIDSEGNFQLPDSSSKSKIALLLNAKRSSQYELRNRDPNNFATLFNVNESLIDIQRLWLSKAEKLRVLQLGSWRGSNSHTEVTNTDFLRSFVYLTGLRYLSFRRISGIHELPPYVFSYLRHLNILDLKGCQDLTKVPAEIGMLKNLTHLDMSECYLLQGLPKEIGNLTELLVLKGLVIWDTESEFACKISDLEKLTKLRKLSIFGSVGTRVEEFTGLSCLEALRSLTITWIGNNKGTMLQEESSKDDLLTKLVTKLPKAVFTRRKRAKGSEDMGKNSDGRSTGSSIVSLPGLEKLDLRCYPESKLPPWINPSLKKLYIRGRQLGCLDADVDAVDVVWKVEVLRVKFLDELALTWDKLRQKFPNLKYVEKVGCPKLESFPCDDDSMIWSRD